MNGASGKPPKQTSIGRNPYLSQSQAAAVFISEGANLPDQTTTQNGLGDFEVMNNQDGIMSPNSFHSTNSSYDGNDPEQLSLPSASVSFREPLDP